LIREINSHDREIFTTMVQEFYQSEAVLHEIPASRIHRTFQEVVSSSPYAKAYILEDAERIAGYALISLTYSNEVGGMVVWIEELYLRQQWQGRGLGSEFLDFIRHEFPAAKRFRLEVTETNKRAQELYLHKGYKLLNYQQMTLDV